MAITVRLFAVLREAAGRETLVMEVDGSQTVTEVLKQLQRDVPAIDKYRPVLSYAINGEYARATDMVHEGDELAVLPPISGGHP